MCSDRKAKNKTHVETICALSNPKIFFPKKEVQIYVALNEDLKNLSKEYNINKTTIELENSDGQLSVPENSELVKQGVEYVAKGGGQYSIKLKGRGRRVLKSSNNIVTKNFDFENLDIVTNDGEFAKETLKQIFE